MTRLLRFPNCTQGFPSIRPCLEKTKMRPITTECTRHLPRSCHCDGRSSDDRTGRKPAIRLPAGIPRNTKRAGQVQAFQPVPYPAHHFSRMICPPSKHVVLYSSPRFCQAENLGRSPPSPQCNPLLLYGKNSTAASWAAADALLDGFLRTSLNKTLFTATLDVCYNSPDSNKAKTEYTKEIRRVFGKLRGKRWICCTTHFVQDHCSIEELAFAYDLIYKLARE